MTEKIHNNTVIAVLLIAVVVSIGGTSLVVYKMNKLASIPYEITGLATSGDGYARIQIEDMLAIEVDSVYDIINFGSCSVSAVTEGGTVSISSEMSQSDINTTTDLTCTGSSNIGGTGGFIQVNNVGNVYANVTVSTNKNGSSLLGRSAAEFYYKSDNASTNGGCADADTQSSYTMFTTQNQKEVFCDNLTYGEDSYAAALYINLTVPWNAITDGQEEATLEFVGHTI